jgi:subtilisin family serine protease
MLFIFVLMMVKILHAEQSRCHMDIKNVLSDQPSQKILKLIIEISVDQAQKNAEAIDMTIASAQKIFIKNAHPVPMKIIKMFKYTPCMAIEINRSRLNDLAAIQSVKRIFPDSLSLPSLSQSVEFVGAKKSWEMGYSGKGQVIAIIDTGVDRVHPFLKGKVISEACFSSQSDGYHSQSICPGGHQVEYGTNSAGPCTANINGYDHGTHVAGIAAGHSIQFSGVARDADIMAIQVFSQFHDSPDNDDICNRMGNTSPCIMSFASDQIKALEFIYDQRNKWKIAAVNMSLSSGKPYAKACDDDPRRPVIDKLYAAGISVIAAAGNNGYLKAISAPACINKAISVGAINNRDVIQPYSNSSDFLDFFAPGFAIQSSIPDGKFARMSGTSMASPHVAGAIAILRSKYKSADIEQLVQTLKTTGKILTDVRNDARVSRIQIDAALSDIPILLPQKPIKGKVKQNQWMYYQIITESLECQYTLKMDDISNDADMYLSQSQKPSLKEWDYRPYKGFRQPETIIFHANQSSQWYVGIYGYRASDFQLSISSIVIRQLSIDNSYEEVLSQGEWHYYKIWPPLSSDQMITIQLDHIKGDMDLYCQYNSLPSLNNFQEKSTHNGQKTEEIQVHNKGKNIYVGVFGYQKGEYRIIF